MRLWDNCLSIKPLLKSLRRTMYLLRSLKKLRKKSKRIKLKMPKRRTVKSRLVKFTRPLRLLSKSSPMSKKTRKKQPLPLRLTRQLRKLPRMLKSKLPRLLRMKLSKVL